MQKLNRMRKANEVLGHRRRYVLKAVFTTNMAITEEVA